MCRRTDGDDRPIRVERERWQRLLEPVNWHVACPSHMPYSKFYRSANVNQLRPPSCIILFNSSAEISGTRPNGSRHGRFTLAPR